MNQILVLISVILIAFTDCNQSSNITLKLGRGSNTTIYFNGKTNYLKITEEGHILLNNQEIGECGDGQLSEFEKVNGKILLVKTK